MSVKQNSIFLVLIIVQVLMIGIIADQSSGLDKEIVDAMQSAMHVNLTTRLVNITATVSTTVTSSTLKRKHFSSKTTTEARPEWLGDAIKDIAYYLRSHKFNEYDRRYYKNGTNAPRLYHQHFPRPPLRSLHWEVRLNCEESFIRCVDYLRGKIKGTALRRQDDTSIVVQENQWRYPNNSREIDQTDLECRKTLKTDFNYAPPFDGPLERYQWRSTASYYMCWFTMNEIDDLKHIGENCDNFAYCMDMSFGPRHNDPRADDSTPFECARYSFCPDPCCSNKHLDNIERCWNNEENPCFDENAPGQRDCSVSKSENIDFTNLILNRWNVSCNCPNKGYIWSSLYGICVDINECSDTKNPPCAESGQSCLNLPGSYECICQWGYFYSPQKQSCIHSDVLSNIMLDSEAHQNISAKIKWEIIMKKVLKFLRKSEYVDKYRVCQQLL
ncbi:uncharacterized protein LOC115886845 [Sitophilus oryzae]|uniref:Uncharacterized protein LOC115886845 n=1 Tax=Sitophilus oryzae TaxID=7048 RepID=A0A6J2YFV8_SITOR|nr:uncharacterized protein LOC115886845 [Sitophilus oryzae]